MISIVPIFKDKLTCIALIDMMIGTALTAIVLLSPCIVLIEMPRYGAIKYLNFLGGLLAD